MEITRELRHGRRGREIVRVTVTEHDLLEDELATPQHCWPLLLDLRAEIVMATTMFRLGLFHKAPAKNMDRAGTVLAELNRLRADLLGKS